MKTPAPIFLATLLACAGPAFSQAPSPPAKQLTPSPNDTDVVSDGLVVYRGQTYLVQNGRAALVDSSLVPEGQILTRDGRLTPLPSPFNPNALNTSQEGVVVSGGQAYLLQKGVSAKIDSRLVPYGQVLTPEGQLAALPSDFSGFVMERTPAGTTNAPPSSQPGTQALSRQAGVPQMSSGPQAPRITTSPNSEVAAPGTSGYTRTGVINNPNGSTTQVGITPNGAAVVLDGPSGGAVLTGNTASQLGGGANVNATAQGGVNQNGTPISQNTGGMNQTGTNGMQQGGNLNSNGTATNQNGMTNQNGTAGNQQGAAANGSVNNGNGSVNNGNGAVNNGNGSV